MTKIENLEEGRQTKSLKILHVSSALTWRGGENQIVLLFKGTRERCTRFLLCPYECALSKHKDIRDARKYFFHKRGGISFSVSKQIKTICKEEKIDIIHVHDSHSHNYALGAHLLNCHLPIVVTRRVDFKPSRLSRLKYNNRNIKRIICVSNHVKKIMKVGGVKASKLMTIYSAVDISRSYQNNERSLSDLGLPPGKKVIGFVGALVDHKDPITFLKMAKMILNERSDCHFVVAGQPGDQSRRVKKFILENRLQNKVSIIGYADDMYSLWSSINILVITSKMEGLGTVVLEAFLSQTPVIATEAGGLKEMLNHNHNGLLAEREDPSDLKRHLMHLLDDSNLMDRLVSQAYKDVQKFSLKRMSDAYLKVYQDVLN